MPSRDRRLVALPVRLPQIDERAPRSLSDYLAELRHRLDDLPEDHPQRAELESRIRVSERLTSPETGGHDRRPEAKHIVAEDRDAGWYRSEAERIEREAQTAADPDLWTSYLALAEAYRKLADTLERTPHT